MKSLKTLSLLFILNVCIFAEDIVVVTVDENGKGSIERFKDLSANDLASVYGFSENVPADTTALILKDGEKAIWTNASRDELEVLYGTNTLEILSNANTYNGKEKESQKEQDAPKEQDTPKKLFEEEEIISNDIQPLDGVWKSVFESTNMTGCSDMMQSMMKKFTPPSSTMTLKFSKPFNPNKDLMSGQFKWKKIKANQWRGTMYKSGAIPMGMSMNGEMLLGVVSEKKMSILLTQKLVLPIEMAQLMGSSKNCTVVTKGHYIKIK